MKSNLSVLFLFLLALSSCQQEDSKTIIVGILPDQPNLEIALIPVNDYFPGLEVTGDYPITTTDSLGNFSFQLDSLKANFHKITQNSYARVTQDLYLESGDSIYINKPKYQSNGLFSITGKGSEKLQYLVSDAQVFPKSASFYNKLRSADFETEMQFKSYVDSIYTKRMTAMDTMYFAFEKLRAHHELSIKAERAEFLLSHLERRNYRMKNFFAYYHPEEAYYDFLDDLDLTGDVANNSALKKMAGTYLTNRTEINIKEIDPQEQWKVQFSERFKYVTSQESSVWNDQLILSLINEYSMAMLQDNFYETLETYDIAIKEQFALESSKALFKNNVAVYTNLAPGKLAPDFALPDSDGNLHKLSDLKGKYVYIDFWGTWCGPCIQEIPAALELQDKYADENIEFLYIALEYDDKDIQRWKDFISGNSKRSKDLFEKDGFPGLHLVADKQFNNEELKPYSLNFAPTHVLIDEDGNIIDARADGAAYVSEQLDALLSGSEDLSVLNSTL